MSESDLRVPDDLETPHVCEGGNLDCGSGLLLLIRKAMNQVPDGQILEIRSTEVNVKEDLPAWCRMTKNPYLGWRSGAAIINILSGKAAAIKSGRRLWESPQLPLADTHSLEWGNAG